MQSSHSSEPTKKIENSFTFVNETPTQSNSKTPMLECKVSITVIDTISDGKSIYNISYDYMYTLGDKSCVSNKIQLPHPFFHAGELLRNHADGDIIIKNPMTTEMVRFLVMDNVELSKYSGNSTPQYYRNMIMFNLAKLWD